MVFSTNEVTIDDDIAAIMQKLCPTWKEAISDLSISHQKSIKEAVADYYWHGKITSLPAGVEKSIFVISKAYIDGKLSIKNIGEGEQHWNWKGGITPENRRIRSSPEYKRWIRQIFSRDIFTCQICGRKGGKLHAHHIKSFAKYPELRLAGDNGITYCEKCHRKWHKEHGRGN